jgi:hypothetical protein
MLLGLGGNGGSLRVGSLVASAVPSILAPHAVVLVPEGHSVASLVVAASLIGSGVGSTSSVGLAVISHLLATSEVVSVLVSASELGPTAIGSVGPALPADLSPFGVLLVVLSGSEWSSLRSSHISVISGESSLGVSIATGSTTLVGVQTSWLVLVLRASLASLLVWVLSTGSRGLGLQAMRLPLLIVGSVSSGGVSSLVSGSD